MMTKLVFPAVLLVNMAHANETLHALPSASLYAGQQTREIKSLSQQDIQSYLAGKGMGMAKAAELNGYPGPMHVLELADKLSLTTEQKQQSEAVFRQMQTRAMSLGKSLVEEERKLDQSFVEKSVTLEEMEKLLARIGSLQARLRQAHLEAHLQQAGILTPMQLAQYKSLRGYAELTHGQPVDDGKDHSRHKGHGH
jgi:Spy/CpxP family protein refolding chaperone